MAAGRGSGHSAAAAGAAESCHVSGISSPSAGAAGPSASRWHGASVLMLPSLVDVAVLTAIIAAAGVLRGFSGFGSSMFAVPLMAMVMPPGRVVPIVLALAQISSIQTLRLDWRDIDWRSGAFLVAWAIPAAMVGNHVLTSLDERTLRIIIGAATVGATFILWRADPKPRPRPGHLVTMVAGTTSGILQGLLGMGGPPLIMYYLRGAFSPHAARASMNVVLLLMTLGPLGDAVVSGRFDTSSLVLFAVLLPTMVVGTWIGGRLFHLAPGRHRAWSLPMLAGVGMLAVWSAVRGA